MSNIPFTLPRTQAEAAAFLGKYGKIIAKPVAGFGAHDIHIITTQAQLNQLAIPGYLLEKYIAGKELRYLILNHEIIGVHRSEYGTSVEENRALQRISYPKALWDPALMSSSLRIADILNLRFAAIDYLVEASGRAYILEVNTIPGFKWFHAPTSGPIVDVARLFLESILDDLCRNVPSTVVSHPREAYS
jgi:glutathione synthase/RimK-type ligase-like ATP-grasp enzyme